MTTKAEKEPTGLDLLRKPFPPHQISKLPKPTKAQTEAVRQDFKKGIRCKICGTWHHPDVVHLDYVGHAALTDRLLDCDLNWDWEPCVEPGLPNPGNGMWIKLTVCGVSRLGYGHADGKSGGDAIKETIGDALRNAAMRFGAALDLWHKGDLHLDDDTPEAPQSQDDDGNAAASSPPKREPAPKLISDSDWTMLTTLIEATGSDAKKLCDYYKVAATNKLTVEQAQHAIVALNNKLKPAPQPTDDLADDAAFLKGE